MLKFILLNSFVCCAFFIAYSQLYTPPLKVNSLPDTENYLKSVFEETKEKIPTDLKGDQKIYLKKLLKSRYESSLKLIKDGSLSDNGYVYQVVDSLFQLILIANPEIAQNKKIYIINDQQVNAFTMGDDLVYINLGILYRLHNFEELIFVLCHEIAHNELNHFMTRSLNYAKNWINDSLEKVIKKAYKKEIGQVSALNEVMVPQVLNDRVESRKFEYAADSMAVSLLMNCGFSFQKALSIFETLFLADHERDTEVLDLKVALQLPVSMDFSRHLNYSKESSLGIFEKEEDTMKKYLQTHPFPEDREILLRKLFPPTQLESNALEIPNFEHFILNVENDMIYNAFRSRNIGKTIFYWLNQQKKYPDVKLMNGILAFSFAVLGYEKMKRREGFIVEMSDNNFDENYERVLFFLKKLRPEECLELASYYLSKFGDSNMILADYSEMILRGAQKDFVRFKPLYLKYKDNLTDDFHSIIEEIYLVNQVSINKI